MSLKNLIIKKKLKRGKIDMEDITDAIADLDEEKALSLVRKYIDAKEDPIKILKACKRGMAEIGKQSGEGGGIFLIDLIMAGEIFKEVLEVIMPILVNSKSEEKGKLVIGTVEGDIHNIGKDIAITFLEVEGINVTDLGVDVPPQKFIEAIKEFKPQVLGLSGLLTLSIEPMKKTIEAISEANLREGMKIIVGGERMDQSVCEYVKADAWVNDAIEGVKIIKNWIEGES